MKFPTLKLGKPALIVAVFSVLSVTGTAFAFVQSQTSSQEVQTSSVSPETQVLGLEVENEETLLPSPSPSPSTNSPKPSPIINPSPSVNPVPSPEIKSPDPSPALSPTPLSKYEANKAKLEALTPQERCTVDEGFSRDLYPADTLFCEEDQQPHPSWKKMVDCVVVAPGRVDYCLETIDL